MLFHLDKGHILQFGTTTPAKFTQPIFHPLLFVDKEKYFGVLINSSGTPSRQVSRAVMKGNQVLGQPLRVLSYRDCYTFIRLYKSYVRPHLEYCVEAWSPWLQPDIDLLENLQKRALKSVSCLTGSHEDKLRQLKTYSLKDRRIRGDMVETYKLLHHIEDVEPSTYFSNSAANHAYGTRQAVTVSEDGSTASPSYKLFRGPSRLDHRANFFSQRIFFIWEQSSAINSELLISQ